MSTGISLFSGAVDGLAIAFEMAGIHVTHHVEYDAFCCANLRRLHPNTTVIEGDIRQLKELPYADVIFGGPPCQGFSKAGSRQGFADPRYLWPEMFRLVKSVRPRCVLVENVRGATSGDNLVDAVLSDLESIDYTGSAFLIPACLFGAPHERYRVFILAYTSSFGYTEQSSVTNATLDEKRNPATHQQGRNAKSNANFSSRSVLGHASSKAMAYAGRNGDRRDMGAMEYAPTNTGKSDVRHVSHRSRKTVAGKEKHRNQRQRTFFQSQPCVGRTAHGPADGMDGFDFPGFPAGQGTYQYPFEPPRTITQEGSYHEERLKALGNAVVWQQAHPFALAIAAWLKAQATESAA